MSQKSQKLSRDRRDNVPPGPRYVPPLNDPVPAADLAWDPRAVESRLIEAAVICGRTAGSIGPKQFGSNWPTTLHDFADLVAQAEGGQLDRNNAERNRIRFNATAAQVTRSDQAMAWAARYLEGHPGPRGVLQIWLLCKATRRKFVKECKKRGWSRATAYRARDKALSIIAIGLSRDGLPPVPGRIEEDD